MSEPLELYHRTSEEAARAILDTGRFRTQENTPEAYVSTHIDGQAAGYGQVIVHVRVDAEDAQLEDEFPDGEQHYRIPLDRAEIVQAFTITPDGRRNPLSGTAKDTRPGSFPRPAKARSATAATIIPARPAPGYPGTADRGHQGQGLER